MLIDLDKITLDQKTQPRVALDSKTIEEYAEAMQAGQEFPPIVVFGQNGSRWLADGWHRLYAAKKAGISQIEAEVKDGNLRDAIIFSCGVNANHGLRRTNADKRRAVMFFLKDIIQWPDEQIAQKCNVTRQFVWELRKELSTIYNSKHNLEEGETVNIQPTSEEDKAFFTAGYEKVKAAYAADIAEMQARINPEDKAKFNRTNDNIEWAAWSWNPVTGCEHDCIYCYARDIANRFYPQGFKPTFYPERLSAPENTNPIVGQPGGSAVFVCSMADLFGSWVPVKWITPVIQSAKDNPQWTFIFLTKNPKRLAEFEFPENAWVGTTIDRQARVKAAEAAMSKVNASVKFYSCEPLLEDIRLNYLDRMDWIIIGGQSRSSQAPEFQPEWEWVWELTHAAYDNGCKVYWKPNLTIRPREYPGRTK